MSPSSSSTILFVEVIVLKRAKSVMALACVEYTTVLTQALNAAQIPARPVSLFRPDYHAGVGAGHAVTEAWIDDFGKSALPNANAALVATDANGNDFVVEADSSLLGNVQPGQTFTAKVTVEGVDQTQNTISGGTGEIPDFLASTFTVTG